jgi:hypothetical protein
MDAIQKYARDLDPGIGQCLLTQSAAAAPSHILPTHPQLWSHAAQPSGVSRGRRRMARPLMRANLLLRSTAHIIQTNVPSAAPRLGMLRNLYRLLAPPSAHTVYYHRTRACVINYWHQGRRRAHSAPPDHPRRKNEENRSITARMPYGSPLVFAQKQTGLLEKCTKWSVNSKQVPGYKGFNAMRMEIK